MNFIEAVKELSKGRCESIISYDRESSYKLVKGRILNSLGISPDWLEITSKQWYLVDEKPKYIEEEVVVWALIIDGVIHKTTTDSPNHDPYLGHGIRLSGTRKVLVKPKVTKREEVVLDSGVLWFPKQSTTAIPDKPKNGRFFYEWEE